MTNVETQIKHQKIMDNMHNHHHVGVHVRFVKGKAKSEFEGIGQLIHMFLQI